MSKWMLVTFLAIQAHFAASYLVPLDRQAQGEFGGLLRWFWPWSYGDGGPLGQIAMGQDLPGIGLFFALAGAGLFGLAALGAAGVGVPSPWCPVLAAIGLGALLGASWLGLKLEPEPFPVYPDGTPALDTVPLPADLPAPVARYFRAVVGSRVPVISTAVVSGRGRLRFSGLTFPTRFRFIHEAGRSYRHDIECTWFGLPILKVAETFMGGHARLALPFGTVEHDPKTDQAANLNLWGEAVWLPSILATDPRVRWEAVNGTTARLIVPFGESEDSSTVVFDEETGLIRFVESRRYRAPSDPEKLVERFEVLEWREFDGVRVPASGALTWVDQGTPWLVLTVEDIAYNVDVAAATCTSA